MLLFTKMQAVGNDFVVVAASEWPQDTDWAQAAIRLCDRKFGVGSDGLLLVGPSAVADLRMRMFNPDGTEDMCGNGLRCVVRHAFDAGVIGANSRIETLAGVRGAAVHADGSITTEMGLPKFAPTDIPTTCDRSQGLIFNIPFGVKILCDAVNTGSAHLVCYLHPVQIVGRFWEGRGAAIENEPFADDDWFQTVSAVIETFQWFPERTSVMWTQVEDARTLRLRIWERGAGETLGCGTGACAAAVASIRRGLVQPGEVTVHSKGGSLRVGWAGGDPDPMYLTGTAHVTYTGAVAADA